MKYIAPKAIKNHPGVLECESGEANASDYKHDVLLKEGWMFESGRMAGCRSGLFQTVADFKSAHPYKSV